MTKTRLQPIDERQEHNFSVDEYKMLRQLDDVEMESLLITVKSMAAGETTEEAMKKSAQYLFSQGREAQARATLALGKQWACKEAQRDAN